MNIEKNTKNNTDYASEIVKIEKRLLMLQKSIEKQGLTIDDVKKMHDKEESKAYMLQLFSKVAKGIKNNLDKLKDNTQ